MLAPSAPSLACPSVGVSAVLTLRPDLAVGLCHPRVIRRTVGSTLGFRLQDNGFVGGQVQYRLKWRDDATGEEVSAVPFGRGKVRLACESQGWPSPDRQAQACPAMRSHRAGARL